MKYLEKVEEFFKHCGLAIWVLFQLLFLPFVYLCKTVVGRILTAIIAVFLIVGAIILLCKFKLNLF